MFVISWSVCPWQHFKHAPLYGRLLALAKNIILGCKGLPRTNTLAYLEHL